MARLKSTLDQRQSLVAASSVFYDRGVMWPSRRLALGSPQCVCAPMLESELRRLASKPDRPIEAEQAGATCTRGCLLRGRRPNRAVRNWPKHPASGKGESAL